MREFAKGLIVKRVIRLQVLRGEDGKTAKLSDQQVRAIRRMSREGQSNADLARVFECSPQHICNIVKWRVRTKDGG